MDDVLNQENSQEIKNVTNSDLDGCFEKISDSLDKIESDDAFSKLFYEAYLAGDRSLYQKDIIETKVFDEEWIRTLESYFPSIDKITNNPKTSIKYESEIVPVEKVRKVGAESVRHLASHTQFVKEVKNGDVIPKKILTNYADEEYAIYENRFVKTLIDRLFIFVTNRYNIIKDNVASFSKNHVNINSNFKIKNANVDVNVDVVVKKEVNNQNERINISLLHRVEKLNQMVLSFRNSFLYKKLVNAPKVNPPIMQTNILVKNPDFKNCYTLWLFLDKYNKLAYDLIVNEKSKKIDKELEHTFDQVAMLAYLSTEANKSVRKTKLDSKDFEKLTKKNAKQLKNNLDDLISNPYPIEVEDNSINEYYLNQFKMLFKKNLEETKKNASSNEIALKQAIRMVNNISNTLYQSYFELEESDMFTRLVKEVDPKTEFEDAKKKATIAKIIREVKEVDYNNALKLEKKLHKDMSKSSGKIIRELVEKSNNEEVIEVKSQLDKEIENYKKAKEKSVSTLVTLDGKKVKVAKAKEDAKINNKAINDSIKEKMKIISKEEKEKSNKKIRELQEAHKARVNEIIENEKANLEKIITKEKEKALKERKLKEQKLKEFRIKEKNKLKEREEKVKKSLKEKELQKLTEEKLKNKEKIEKTKEKLNEAKDGKN